MQIHKSTNCAWLVVVNMVRFHLPYDDQPPCLRRWSPGVCCGIHPSVATSRLESRESRFFGVLKQPMSLDKKGAGHFDR